jgi:predicted nucleotidyltransferase
MVVDIGIIEQEIALRLKRLNPDKIIIFGSYASGPADDESDIDICIIKNLPKSSARAYTLQARKHLRDLVFKYKIGFDIITVPENFIHEREDPFYSIDILTKGKVIYAK